MRSPSTSFFRASAAALALALLACQQPVAPVAAPPQADSKAGVSAEPQRRLLEVRDAAELQAAFDAAYGPDTEFGGAPDPQALVAAAETTEGRAATSIAMRGKTGWIYLVPAPYDAAPAGYKLSSEAAAGLTPEEDDRRRMLAMALTKRERRVPQPKRHPKFRKLGPAGYQLQEAGAPRTLGDSLDEFKRAREIEREIPPPPPNSHPPDDEDWQLEPTPPDQYPKITVPAAYKGGEIGDVAHCYAYLPGMVQYIRDNGGTATIIYPGYPYIIGCDRYAGYVPGRGFSGETMQLGPSTYYVTKTAFQEWAFPQAGLNTQITGMFTIPSRSPGSSPPPLGPEEYPGWPVPGGQPGHVPTTGFDPSTRPAGPTLWEGTDGKFGVGDAPDSGVRGGGGGSGPSSEPTIEPPPQGSPGPSGSPTAEPSPTPEPVKIALTSNKQAVLPLGNYEWNYGGKLGNGYTWNYGLDQAGKGVVKLEVQTTDNNGSPFGGKRVLLESTRVPATGGHDHDAGPTGSFSLDGRFPNVSMDDAYTAPETASTEVTTGADGRATVFYRAYGFGGEEKITATVENGPPVSWTLTIGEGYASNAQRNRFPRFNPVGLANVNITSHPNDGLYGQPATLQALKKALTQIKARMGKTFTITGISLSLGGPYDVARDWVFTRAAHQPNPALGIYSGSLHRNGFEVDIATDDQPGRDYADVYLDYKVRNEFEDAGFLLLNKEVPGGEHLRHWHWWYEADRGNVPVPAN